MKKVEVYHQYFLNDRTPVEATWVTSSYDADKYDVEKGYLHLYKTDNTHVATFAPDFWGYFVVVETNG
jgi:hypothetical protein